jgi:hypothetical protein
VVSRRARAVLSLVLITISLAAFAPTSALPPPILAAAGAPGRGFDEPLRCTDTKFSLWTSRVTVSRVLKGYLIFDVARQNRCAGRAALPLSRLHTFMVITHEKLGVRAQWRLSRPGILARLCGPNPRTCLDLNFEVRWSPVLRVGKPRVTPAQQGP